MNDRPNVLMLFTDDQRFDTIHALGNLQIHTPNMDRLVKSGVSFTQAHIPSGMIGAVCMPSRAMLLTGRNLFRIDGAGHTIPETHIMIGELLQKNGYESFGTGKWHNGTSSYNRNHDTGTHIFFGGMADHWNVKMYDRDPLCKYEGKGPYIKNFLHSNEIKNLSFDYRFQGRHSSEIIADAGVKYLNERDKTKSFFMYLSFLAPHDPRTMPKRFLKMYEDVDIELPPNFLPKHPFRTGELKHRDEKLAAFPRAPQEIKRHIKEYYAMITHLDYEIGKVLTELENQGLMNNTIIVLAGDNGLALGQHGLMGKQSCYEHSNHVPLIFTGPGIPRNVRTDSFAYLLDIYPTLCDYLDIPIPKSVDGKSLKMAMETPNTNIQEDLYIAFGSSQRAVKTKQYKLIEYVFRGKHIKTQLFDLVQDPWETTNLSEDPDMFEVIESLRGRLIHYRDDWDELTTHWGKIWWNGFLKSNPKYRDERTRTLDMPSKIKHKITQLRLWIKSSFRK